MQATYQIYLTDEAQEKLRELCREFYYFEGHWENALFWLTKSPGKCDATHIGQGYYYKELPIIIPEKGIIGVVFKYNQACVNIFDIAFTPG